MGKREFETHICPSLIPLANTIEEPIRPTLLNLGPNEAFKNIAVLPRCLILSIDDSIVCIVSFLVLSRDGLLIYSPRPSTTESIFCSSAGSNHRGEDDGERRGHRTTDLAAPRQERSGRRALRSHLGFERILHILLKIDDVLRLSGIRLISRICCRACDAAAAATAEASTLFDFGTAVCAKHRFSR